MEKLLIILLLSGIPANVFLFLSRYTGGEFIIKALLKLGSMTYLIVSVIIVLKYYNLI